MVVPRVVFMKDESTMAKADSKIEIREKLDELSHSLHEMLEKTRLDQSVKGSPRPSETKGAKKKVVEPKQKPSPSSAKKDRLTFTVQAQQQHHITF